MNWSSLLPWLHGKKRPIRRHPSTVQLALETLEDRLAPAVTYQQWAAQTFSINDVVVPTTIAPSASSPSIPQNASFGSMIGLPSVFANTAYRGQGYSVAVIDTGIDYNDPALGGGFGPGHKVVAGWDFVNNDADPMDDNGHGSVVAGEIASTDPTYSGVAPGANLIALKVLAADGSGTFGNVQAALEWVIANRAKYNIVAINLSLGAGNYTTNPYTFLDTDFAALTNNGVFISVAAGNSFYSFNSAPGLAYPAVDSGVVSVGAVWDGNYGAMAWVNGARDNTTAVDRIASFSQRSANLDIMAPGAMITSIGMGNKYVTMAGTSMAAPVIAGAAVLIHQALDAQHKLANQTTILSIMQKTGVTVKDGDDENDNVTNTGLSFKRIDLNAAINSVGTAVAPPSLAAIANQTVAAGSSINVTLSGSDPANSPLTYSATVSGTTASTAYALDQKYGFYYLGSYYTNTWGQQEKFIAGTGGVYYIILPDGELRKWVGSISTTLLPANLIATLDGSYYDDPSLLWNAKPAAGVSATVSGNTLTLSAPAGASGTYQVTATVSNGSLSVSQTFTVTVSGQTSPTQPAQPTLAPISNQSATAGGSLQVTLTGSDPSNHALTYSAAVGSSLAATVYGLDQKYGLSYLGTYYTNAWNLQEKHLGGAGGKYYIILPDGEFRLFAGSVAATLKPANLIATLDASYYNDPSLLWNARPAATLSTSVSGNRLTVQVPASALGSYQIIVTVSNGSLTASQSFNVSIAAPTAPTLAPISNQTMSAGSSLALTLNGSTGLAYTASVTGSNAAASQLYQLDQQLKLKYLGSYYTNVWGHQEKFLTSASGLYYIILPNGELRRWAGSIATTLQPAYLIATLDTSVYADPSLLWNAQPAISVTVTVTGTQLKIVAPAGTKGTFTIKVTGTLGTQTVTQTFTVTVS